jgi:2-methylisocitrate lyase-like PEP mutase family enzyme
VTGLIDKFAAFKALHERPQAFVMPNPWNAGTARILATLGFEALATTSAGLAFSIGRRDSAQGLTRQQVLENAKAIVESTDLPVSGDLEDGFGTSPQDCASTIVAASSIGLVGGNIEDATGDPNDPIFAFNHAVERIAAACEAARSLPFVLTARADGLIWGRPDLDDTIRRLQAFSKAGAHVLYAPGLSKLEDIRTVCTAVDKPLNVVMGLVGARFSVAELQSTGVKRISVGGSFARVALSAFIGAAREVKDRGTFDYAVDAISDADAAAYMANEKR